MKEIRPEQDAERLRDLLRKAAPDDGDSDGRAGSVVRRARRDRARKGVLGTVAIAAVAAAVIVTPHFLRTSPTTNEHTDPTNGVDVIAPIDPAEVNSAPDPLATDPCPSRPIDVTKPATVSALPPEVRSVRMCAAVIHSRWMDEPSRSLFEAPVDGVVAGIDDFVASIAEAPEYDANECAAIDYTFTPVALVFTSKTGDRTVLGAPAPICNAVEIGGRQVSIDWLTSTYMDALERQRAAIQPPADITMPGCAADPERAYSTFANAKPTPIDGQTKLSTDFTGGIVCSVEVDSGSVTEGVLDADQASTLAADAEANAQGEDGECSDLDTVRSIRLVGAWGDVTTWTATGCEGGFEYSGYFWNPSDESEEIISAALR